MTIDPMTTLGVTRFTTTTLAKCIGDAKTAATQFGLGLTAYEGGQSLTNNPAIPGDLAVAANADPRMYTLYHDLMNVWRQQGGGLEEGAAEVLRRDGDPQEGPAARHASEARRGVSRRRTIHSTRPGRHEVVSRFMVSRRPGG